MDRIWEFITSNSWLSIITVSAFSIGIILLTYFFVTKKTNDKPGAEPKKRGRAPKAGEIDRSERRLAGVKKALSGYAARGENKAAWGLELKDPKSKQGASVYIDAVLIGYYGVTIVIGCDLVGDVYLNDSDDEISCVISGQKMRLPNPCKTAKLAARVMRDVLRKNNVYRVPVNDVVIVTNKRAKVIAPRSLEYYTPDTMKKALRAAPYTQDNDVDVAAVYAAVVKEAEL